MSKPVLFSTIDRQFGLYPGTVSQWADRPGFPLSDGEGVAVPEAVRAWAEANPELTGFIVGAGDVDAAAEEPEAAELNARPGDFFAGIADDPNTGADPGAESEPVVVEYVTIRVPVVRGSGTKLPSRINQTFTLRKSDTHIREAFGDILAGCIQSGKQLEDKSAVNNFSAVYRLLGELVSSALSASSASSA